MVVAASRAVRREDKAHEFAIVRKRKAAVLWYLLRHGPLRDPSGRATSLLYNATVEALKLPPVGTPGFSAMLSQLEADGFIRRAITGKRTHSISLAVDEATLRADQGYGKDPFPKASAAPLRIVERETGPALEQEPEPEQAPVVNVVGYEPEPDPTEEVVELVSSNPDPHNLLAMAMTLIGQAIATSKPIDRTDPDVLARLAATLEENQRLRGKLSASGDEVRALRDEIAGLRKAKAALQDNLRTIANGRLDEQALRRFRELDRLVREAPGPMKAQ